MVVRLVLGNTVLLALSRRFTRGRTVARKPRLPLVVRVLSALRGLNALSEALAACFGHELRECILDANKTPQRSPSSAAEARSHRTGMRCW